VSINFTRTPQSNSNEYVSFFAIGAMVNSAPSRCVAESLKTPRSQSRSRCRPEFNENSLHQRYVHGKIIM